MQLKSGECNQDLGLMKSSAKQEMLCVPISDVFLPRVCGFRSQILGHLPINKKFWYSVVPRIRIQ